MVRLPRRRSIQSKRRAHPPHVRFLTVGQTARILGISPSTLRLWESVGLVTPARSAGSYRLYTPELLDVLKRIGIGLIAGAGISAVDNFAFRGEISPIAIVGMLLIVAGSAASVWGVRAAV